MKRLIKVKLLPVKSLSSINRSITFAVNLIST